MRRLAPRGCSLREKLEFHSDRRSGDCWVWTAATMEGYGYVNWNGKMCRAHRLAYTEYRGPIPEGLQLDHLCRNRACINPDHLEPVDCLTNVRRSHHPNVLATACPRGHEYDEANTYRTSGRRYCRTCSTAYERLRRHLTPEECDRRRAAGLPLVDLAAYFAEQTAA